jgi:hypothetical protein
MPNYHKPIILDRATPAYRALLLECERRRHQLGWAMWQLDEIAGLNDGHFAHCLHADRPTGRQAQWKTLQLIIDALWPRGFDFQIIEKPGATLTAEGTHRKILHAAAPYNRISQRKLMSTLGKKGAAARKQKYANMTEEERHRVAKTIAKKARKTRRQNKLLRSQAGQITPKSKRATNGARACVVEIASDGASCTVGAIGAPAE